MSDTVALPQALQAQLTQMQQQPQQPAPQQTQQPQQPAPQQFTPQQPQGQQPAPQQPQQPQQPASPMQDADLQQFFVDIDQPAQTSGFGQQPQQQWQQPQQPQQPWQQTWQQQQNPYGQQPYNPAPNGGFDPSALARIEQAQRAMLDAFRQNAAGQQQAGTAPVTQQPDPAAQATELAIAIEGAELTDAEKGFLQGREAVFQKLFANYAKAQIEPLLQRLADAYKQQTGKIGELERNSATQRQHTTRQLITANIPDFDTIIQQPQFAAFMRDYIPEVGVTRAEILRNAIQRGDIGLIQTHIARYKQAQGAVPDGGQAAQALQQPTAQPRAPQVQGNGQPARRVTEETLLQAEGMMMKGQLDPKKFEQLVGIYRQQTQGQGAVAPQRQGFRSA